MWELQRMECIVERGAYLDLDEDKETLPAHHQVDLANGRLVASGEKPKTLETVGQGTYGFGPTSLVLACCLVAVTALAVLSPF